MKNNPHQVTRFTLGVKHAIRLSLIAFTFAFGLSAAAQKKHPENTLLWEISGNGLTKPSYLFGTYHFADKGFVDTMKIVNEKLNLADAVVGELIMDAQVVMKLLPYMMLKDTTLDKLLNASEYQLVAKYLKKVTNYDLKNFNKFSPMAIQTIVIQAEAPKTITESNPAIDQYFQDYGREKHKNILGLETVEEQAKMLFGGSLERQKEQLLKSVKEGNKNKEQSEKIYRFYITQNIKALENFFLHDTDFNAEEMDRLLKNRNAKWIAALPAMMQGKSLFIAVGAGHLVGNDGLIKGLRAKGYTVKPVATN